tara:strand:+ start:12376 stop:13512 length:1137 start_codon:yes stop_codon:yes gene_type:complete
MQIVVLASQKGGSGKTTLSGHLAVEAERSGLGPVVLIDTDPQGSLSDWWNARAAETPTFARVAIEDLGDCLAQLREAGVKLVVIDTPPAITHSIASVVAHADLVLIPARPSPHDLRAVGATIDIVEHFGKPLVFVINAATARAKITGESAVALSQHGTVAPVTLHHRVDFAASMVDGKTIGEIDAKSKSAREISDLWSYVAGRLSRMSGAVQGMPAPARITTDLGALSALSAAPVASPEVAEVEEVPVPQAPDETVIEPPPLPEPVLAAEPAPEPEPELELELEPEDVVAAIREGASVAFAFDPEQLSELRSVSVRPVSVAPPPPVPSPKPVSHVVRADQALPDGRSNVFGRRGLDRASPVSAAQRVATSRQYVEKPR